MADVLAVNYESDNLGSLIGYAAGIKVAALWGPAVDGDWFVALAGQQPQRVPSRDEAVRMLPATWPALALPTTQPEGEKP
jgi:hypothetical protein